MSADAERLLVVRLSALGDLVHTLPAIPALRAGFPGARLDWVVDQRWAPLLGLAEGIDEVVHLERSAAGFLRCVRQLRRGRYSRAIDFQGVYRSAALTWMSGAPRRFGRDRATIREPGAEHFYNQHFAPSGGHVAEMNLGLAAHAGAKPPSEMRFPLHVPPEEMERVQQKLRAAGIGAYVVVSPGGGWTSKRWPPERYGALAAELWRQHEISTMVNVSPSEKGLADAIAETAEPAHLLAWSPEIPELAALVAGAALVVGGDTGPVHLAAALGTRVVALFGGTDPARNGPLPRGSVVQNRVTPARDYERGNYERGRSYSPTMLSISVAQVLGAAEREMNVPA
jgi:lipopolysaccharide heptosyltransferase I